MWRAFLLGMSLLNSTENNMIEAPFGSWRSPITSDTIVADATRLGGVEEVGGVIYLLESRPQEKGRSVLLRLSPDGSFKECLPPQYNIRTTVHEYGGGSLLIEENSIYFSNFADQQLYYSDFDGVVKSLTHEKNSRFADGRSCGKWLFYVMEEHADEVENCIVAIDRTTGALKKIARGSDFYAAPRPSPDGKKLAYYAWNHPNMPWDGGELRVAELNEDGTLGDTFTLAGGENESICQHAWGPDGLLYYVSDRSGWWNLYNEKGPLYPMEAEMGFPQWNFGATFFDFWGTDKIVCLYSEKGVDRLAILSDQKLTPIEVPFTAIDGISVAGDHLYFMGSSPTLSSSCVQYNLKTQTFQIIKKSREDLIRSEYISVPQAIEFPTSNGKTAHAFYYPPLNPSYRPLPNERPPLLVMSHGGPTAHTKPTFDLEIQYWTSRGIAVVDVNYGGSSGYGREYRNRLNGNWGIVDVDDCTNAALYCAKQGLADANRLCIEGGSAGGYTTLACLTFRDIFKAGASYFGVSDLEALALDTHKFESRYLDKLVGPYPAKKELYIERSPIHHVDQIQCPIILLQGDEDKIVPPAQSEKMYDSLVKRGIPTAYLLFQKEQHGFRQADNIKRSLDAVNGFFAQIFGYTLADPIQPLNIVNFHE